MDMQGWKDAFSFDWRDSLALAAAQELENRGVSVPKLRLKSGGHEQSGGSSCFGVALEAEQDRLPFQFGEFSFALPRVFVESVHFLERNVTYEGIFRKTGSVTRQKAIRAALSSGSLLDTSNVHDVANLLKQYLRELPSSLLRGEEFTSVFEDSHGKEQNILLACLLLPQTHLQCLRVLMRLLSAIASHENSSLMDASSLAVVMSPNLIPACGRGRTNISALDNSLKVHTGIVKTLIERSRWIGLVPPDIIEHAQKIAESAVDSVPERYQRRKKHRTASISGLVQGLSSRLKSMGGGRGSSPPHSPSQGPQERGVAMDHVTQHDRRALFKRKGASNEDLVGASKKPALFHPSPAFPLPHPPTHTPHGAHKKRRSLLNRRRHTDQSKQHQSRLARLVRPNHTYFKPLGAVKLDFEASQTNSSVRGLPKFIQGDSGTSSSERVQLVGFTALPSPRKPVEKEVVFASLVDNISTTVTNESRQMKRSSSEEFLTAKKNDANSRFGLYSTAGLLGDEERVYKSQLLSLHESQDTLLPPSRSVEVFPPSRNVESFPPSRNVGSTIYSRVCPNAPLASRVPDVRISFPSEHPDITQSLGLPSVIEEQSSSVAVCPDITQSLGLLSTYTACKSSTKRMRCEVNESMDFTEVGDLANYGSRQATSKEDDTTTMFRFKPPTGIRMSRSDHQLQDATLQIAETSSQPPPTKIPNSVSFPNFPLSLPYNRLGGQVISQPPATPSEVKNCLKTSKSMYTFSNPRPVKPEMQSLATDKSSPFSNNNNHSPSPSGGQFQDGSFEIGRRLMKCDEAMMLDDCELNDSLNPPISHGNKFTPAKVTPQFYHESRLDEAFLQTPYPHIHSPNLLDKINHEIATRHQYSPCTPSFLTEVSIKINDSYKRAVLGGETSFIEPLSLDFNTNDVTMEVEDVPNIATTDRGPNMILLSADQPVQKTVSDTTIRKEAVRTKESGNNCIPKSKSDSNIVASTENRVCTVTPERKRPSKKQNQTPKTHHKRDGVRWFGTPSHRRGFTFSLPSPWSRGGNKEQLDGLKVSKRAQVYMDTESHPPAESPTSPSHLVHKPPPTITPSHHNKPPPAITPLYRPPPPPTITPSHHNKPPPAITPLYRPPPPPTITPSHHNKPPPAITPLYRPPPPPTITPSHYHKPPPAITPLYRPPPPPTITPSHYHKPPPTITPSHHNKLHKVLRRRHSLQQVDKENSCVDVGEQSKGGHMWQREVQVKEWVV